MSKEETLFSRCHINTNAPGDRFVGVRVVDGSAEVCFPPGYQCPDNESSLRMDIIHLLAILEKLGRGSTAECRAKVFDSENTGNMPISAYLEIIQDFLKNNRYYQERECEFKKRDRGKIDWRRTIHQIHPLFDGEDQPVYLNFIIRKNPLTENSIIANIHKFIVFDSFVKFGWLYTSMMPERSDLTYNASMFSSVIQAKLSGTYNDEDKKLLSNMLAVINQHSPSEVKKDFFYGTENFEYVWEQLIDIAFGVTKTADCFPTTCWHFRTAADKSGYIPDPDKENAVLRPDTIMKFDGKIFILDAKYYKYGFSTGAGILPSSYDINKQITYGEQIHNVVFANLKEDEDPPVYNAFVLPYNSSSNRFGRCGNIEIFGEATTSWKEAKKGKVYPYERVLGVLLDVRYLLNHFSSQRCEMQRLIATEIQNAINSKPCVEVNCGI